ncbi:PA domain-containing protein [Pelomonas sp. Root1237]|uniref:PA domain-containing protein n=1 Tax=Pelomonas sp. Root1237 TaxID=1736434 RepID=UPI0006FD6C9C|nr:PA domain-containing protein [Pelomonas sp. Root1237]KQV91913.1 peptidase [Pelomonas sp. Root1237]
MKKSEFLGALAGVLLAASVLQAQAAATIVIQNLNAAGEGFNDPTPAAPVGGNAGTTLGQQRLIAFQTAANVWGATLTSSQTIVIRASFEPLTCTATSAVLGSAGAWNIWRDFAGAAKVNTWYPQALANKLAGVNLSAGDPVDGQDIRARFNSRLGLFADCLPGSPFYLGLDNNHGPNVDLVTVLLHEFAHGLGFQTFTSGSSGAQFDNRPSIWDHYIYDDTAKLLWVDMTNSQRAESALNTGKLTWSGAGVLTSLPTVLSLGTPSLTIGGPAAGSAAGPYNISTASFGAPLSSSAVTSTLMPVVDTGTSTGLACNPLSAANALAVNGRIALVDRGTCTFAIKAKNVQNAGAIGAIVVNNVAGSAPALGGADPTVTIPVISVSLADGNLLKTALSKRTRTSSGVTALMSVNASQYAGADIFGRARLFAPNPFQSGSSVSHFDTIAFPNLLMEPAINGDLLHAVTLPQDLTFALLKDIGW